jgi:hypothetical protein
MHIRQDENTNLQEERQDGGDALGPVEAWHAALGHQLRQRLDLLQHRAYVLPAADRRCLVVLALVKPLQRRDDGLRKAASFSAMSIFKNVPRVMSCTGQTLGQACMRAAYPSSWVFLRWNRARTSRELAARIH